MESIVYQTSSFDPPLDLPRRFCWCICLTFHSILKCKGSRCVVLTKIRQLRLEGRKRQQMQFGTCWNILRSFTSIPNYLVGVPHSNLLRVWVKTFLIPILERILYSHFQESSPLFGVHPQLRSNIWQDLPSSIHSGRHHSVCWRSRWN